MATSNDINYTCAFTCCDMSTCLPQKKTAPDSFGAANKKQGQDKKQCDSRCSDAEEQTGGLGPSWAWLQALWLLPTTSRPPQCARLFLLLLSLFGPAVTWWHVLGVAPPSPQEHREDKYVLVFINSNATKTKIENINQQLIFGHWLESILPPKECF